MEYDDVRTYQGSEWAAQRWDWFHGGRIVQPLSFCQFWRTVLVWATIKWFLTPLRWLDRVTSDRTLPTHPMPSVPWRFALLPVKGCWFALRLGARGLWRLTYPLRMAGKGVGGVALSGIVTVGEPVGAFGETHIEGLKNLVLGLVVLVYGSLIILFVILCFLANWLVTLIVISSIAGGITVGGFALYGFFKSGAPGLLWQAAVATHHGVCPPVRIVRDGEGA